MEFKDIPIQKKLMRFIFLIGSVVLITTCLTFFIYEYYSFKQNTIEKVSTIGKIISSNSTAALAFDSPKDAKEILSALKSEPYIESASIYNFDRKLFAQYPSNITIQSFPVKPKQNGNYFSYSYLETYQPVIQENKILGTLYLKYNLDAIYERYRFYGLIVFIAVGLSFLFAYIISRSLKKTISNPILSLAETARVISDKNDFTVRAVKLGNDEIGSFTDSFNQMLDKIQSQNITLNEFNKNLEQKVNDRTSDLVKLQESLQESEEKYRKIIEEAGDVVFSTNIEGNFTYINPIGEKLTGFKVDELIGKKFDEIIDPEWKMKAVEFYREQLTKGIQETLYSFPIITKSGEQKWVEQIVTQQKKGDLVIGHHAIVRDITQRKKNELEIKEKTIELNKANKELNVNEKQIQAIFESAPDAVIVINHESSIQKWNHKAEKLFGWESSEVLEKPLYDFIIPERYRERHKNGMKHYLTTGKGPVLNKEIEIEAINKKGKEFSVLLSISPVDIEDKILFIGFIRDITEKKKNELLITQKSLELERSNKEYEQFAYIASHDLQEPLRMVTSYLQLLEKKYKDKLDQDANEFIHFAVDGSSRMKTLIFSLLEYSRVNRVKPLEDINLNELLIDVQSDLKISIQESKSVIKVEQLPVIYGDKLLINQLFQNLISNAVKFKGERDPEIIISGKEENKEYLFSVKDNGIGIQKEYADKLFTIFQRLNTKENYPGTGIGLAICKKIVEKHGGKIWFESEFGVGTTFYFTLKKKEDLEVKMEQAVEVNEEVKIS